MELWPYILMALLRKTPLFAQAVTDDDVERSMVAAVVSYLHAHVVFNRDVVLQEGDATAGVFFIHSGLVELRASFLRKFPNKIHRQVARVDGSRQAWADTVADPLLQTYGGVFGDLCERKLVEY